MLDRIHMLSCWASLALACGAAHEEVGGEEVGQLAQRYSAPVTNNYQFGTNVSDAHVQCDRLGPQVCSVPSFKTIEMRASGVWSATELTSFHAVESAIDAATNFTFNIVAPDAPRTPNTIDLTIHRASVLSNPGNNIEHYSSVLLNSVFPLTEGVVGGDPVGQYERHGACIVRLDTVDMYAKGANATEDDRIFRHGLAHGLLTCMGLGSRADSGANGVYSRRSLNLGSNLGAMTAGEACRADRFFVDNNGDFSLQGVGGLCGTVD